MFVVKTILTIVNSLFVLLSLLLVAAGCLVLYAGDFVLPFCNLLLQHLSSNGAIIQSTEDVYGVNIAELASQIAWPTVICGGVLYGIGFIGCCGAHCEHPLLLAVYSAVIGVVIAGETAAVAIFAGGQNMFKQKAIDGANDYVRDQYRGDNSSDALSVILNIAQMGLHCCGINNYTFLQQARYWNRTGTFTDDNGKKVTGTLQIPFSCCNMSAPFPSITPVDINCGITLNVSTSYYNTSCFSKVEGYINEYSFWAIIGAAAIFASQLLILLLAVFIIYENGTKTRVRPFGKQMGHSVHQ